MPTKKELEALAAPFPADSVKWRVGSTNKDKTRGLALAYIDARHVFERLDEVVGAERWQTGISETASGRVLCVLRIDGVEKEDGAGDTGMEAEKGAISDAIKRAAVQWGIGRYLYSLPAVWCRLEPMGKSYKLAETPDLPAWATKGKKAAKKTVEKTVERESNQFADAVMAEKARGVAELIEHQGESRQGADKIMEETVADILKGMAVSCGKSYVSYYEIDDREHQESFFKSLRFTINEWIKKGEDG